MERLSELLTKEYLARLEAMTISIQNALSVGYSGGRKSHAKGSSLEFSDFREYTTGDDIRRIDWNTYGRFDRLFLKLFMEEKQANINIFLDTSASMDFGKVNKGVYAKQLAATLAYIGIKNMDRVNLFACDQKIVAQKTGIQTKNQFLDVVNFLDGIPIQNETQLSRAILEAGSIGLGRGISIIISDFFSSDGYEESVKALQYQKQDILLVQVLSEEELEPALSGNIRLIDSENGQSQDFHFSSQVLEEYKKALQGLQNQMREFCYKRGARYVRTCTEVPVLQFLSQSMTLG